MTAPYSATPFCAGSDAFEPYVGVLQMAQMVTLAAEGGAQPPSQQELQAKLGAFQKASFCISVSAAALQQCSACGVVPLRRQGLPICCDRLALLGCARQTVANKPTCPPSACAAALQERVAKLVAQLRDRLAAYPRVGKQAFEEVGAGWLACLGWAWLQSDD